MKSVLTKILNENQFRKKIILVWKIKINNNLYEVIVLGYESVLESIDRANNDIIFKNVAIVTNKLE